MFRCRSEWARCISLALLLQLNVLFITTGSAIPLRNGYLQRIVRQSSATEGAFRIFKSYGLSHVPAQLKDSGFRDTLHADGEGDLVPKFLDATAHNQFRYEANSQTEEIDRETGDKYGSRNRRFLRGPRGPGRPRVRGWLLKQHQGRSMMEGSNTTTATGEQTQAFYLGPPAPPGIVHNEKQDWNQDYAEPDVHPPSSN